MTCKRAAPRHVERLDLDSKTYEWVSVPDDMLEAIREERDPECPPVIQ